ncbi:MAG: hypothetical protein AAFV19_12050 [Pseudomonadota bacterium]
MDKTLFLSGFAVMLGIFNIWTARNTGGKWLWVGIAMIVFGVTLFIVDNFVIKIMPA